MAINRQNLLDGWERVLNSTHWTEGVEVKTLEDRVSRYYHQQNTVAFNSGGTALYAVIASLGLKNVLVPNNTFYATGAMVRESKATITLVDNDPTQFSMTLDKLKNARRDYHDGVVLTHVGGTLARDYKAIALYCEANDLTLVEDAAHVFGVNGEEYPGKYAPAVFSLYPTKAIPVGEGGLVITHSLLLAEKLKRFRNYGKYTQDGIIKYSNSGFNFRMDEWTAVVAAEQVKRIPIILDLRHTCAHKLAKVVTPLVDGSEGNWYKFIAPSDFPAKKQTGKVYAVSDQLHYAMNIEACVNGSILLAESHICLPVGELLYKGLSTGEIEKYLLGD